MPYQAIEKLVGIGACLVKCYDPELQENGVVTQSVILLQLLARSPPTLVSFMATQKTKATKKTMSMYSTNPCPSPLASNFLKTLILLTFRIFYPTDPLP